MNIRLLLVNAVTLLYKESITDSSSGISTGLVSDLLQVIRKPDSAITSDFKHDPVTGLYDILTWMIEKENQGEYDINELLQKLRVACGTDDSLYLAVEKPLTTTMDEKSIKSFINKSTKSIKQFLKEDKIRKIFKEAYIKTSHKSDKVDWRHISADVIEALEPYTTADNNGKHPGFVARTDFGDKDSIKKTLIRAKEESSSDGVLRTGLQGLNRMCGPELNGFRRGELITIAALQHNYKSGMALDIFRHMAQYNKPFMLDESKKPALVRVSFENSNENDTSLLYKRFYEQEFGVPVFIKDVDPEDPQVIDYVHDKLSVNGYRCIMEQYDPSEFTFRDLFALIEDIEAEGYEIHSLNIDYLGMMSKRGCNTGPAGAEYVDLFRRVRNFCFRKKITCITPAQMSTDAKRLLRGGVENFLQQIANKGYYDSCSRLDMEIDLELYLHIQKVNGESYLCIRRGKHRKPGITPEKDLYCVYKFSAIGDIIDDVLSGDMSRRSVGGNTMADGGGLAWYDEV